MGKRSHFTNQISRYEFIDRTKCLTMCNELMCPEIASDRFSARAIDRERGVRYLLLEIQACCKVILK